MGQYNLSDAEAVPSGGTGAYSLADATPAATFTANATAKADRNFLQKVGDIETDAVNGVLSGVVKSSLHVYRGLRKIPGLGSILPAPSPDVEAAKEAPNSFAGKAGQMLEQAGEYIVPLGEIAKITKGAPLIAKLVAKALAAGGVAGLQTGGDLPAMAETAATTGILDGLGAAIPAGTRAAARAILPRLVAGGSPLSPGAEALATRFNVPLTEGMRSGSPAIQSAEGMLGNTVAPDLYRPVMDRAQTGLNAGAKELSGQFAVDKFTAGDNTVKTMLRQAQDYADQARDEYSNLAQHEANPANVRSVQTGTKQAPVLNVQGNPMPGQVQTVPVMESMGLPVDMRPAKALLTPEVDNIQRFMTPMQKRADPGLAAIQNILSRPDHIPASVAEGDLSYLKEVLRSDATPQAKRLAGKAIDAMEPQVQAAVARAGRDATTSLNDARGAWQARASILDQVKELTGDTTGEKGQARLAATLLRPGDASYPALQKVLLAAPDAGEDLGKAYLTETVFKGAQGEDVNPKQAANLWNHIGPRTKAALYTPQQISDINDFLALARRVAENPNPSNGGALQTLLKVGVLATSPVGAGTGAFVVGRNVARVLYSPQGAAALRAMISAPGSAEASKAMLIIKTLMNARITASDREPDPTASQATQ